ncbi:hypothetical protein QBC39DRAFT_269560 [Podospora conica]|nr:hypothetical protein QBC39DRAFT_269560 [Schizothecium conicum]
MLALDRRQQNASPCPNRNGGSLGTAQPFTIVCGSDIGGTTMDTFDAFDLRTCADICSSFHPRCDGATFDGRNCQLRSRLSPGNVRQARSLDSVVASFPSASSNCATLGATTSLGGTAWTLACGKVIAGFDIGQEHALNLQDCMGICSSTSSCAAVTFDPSLDQGFKNCYLKSQVTDSGVIVQDARVDTALMQSAGNASPNEGGTGPSPTPFPNQGVATVPLPTPTGGSGNGAVFFMPPSNTVTSASTDSSPAPTDLTPSPTQLAPPQFLPTGTGGFTSPDANQQGGGNRDGNNNDDDNSTSNAWIAAPVVGSVAAIALIVLSFVMLKRRRLGNNGRNTLASQSSSDSLRPATRKSNISRPKALSAMITSWLPAAARGDRGSSGSGARGSRGKMGNFSEVESATGRGRGSMRTSVTGLVRPTGDVEEGEGGEKKRGDLRHSLNGLGQNRWS